MSKRITQKLALAIATEMVARLYNESIQYTEEQLSNAMTSIAKKRIPKEVFEFVKKYPEFITTTQWMSVTSILYGKRAYLDARVSEPIPNKPLYYAVSENTFRALMEIKTRNRELRNNRADRQKEIFERIYHECVYTKKLEREYPEAYRIMMEMKTTEEETER